MNSNSILVGSVNQDIWAANITTLSRTVWLKSFAVKVIGSAPAGAIMNYRLYVGGVQFATAAGADANGIVTFDLSSSPQKIDSTKLIEVRADVVKGSARTFTVSLQNKSDIQLIDDSYNVVVPVTFVGGSTIMTSGTWTINGAALTVIADRATDSPSDNIISGASNISFAKFTLKAYGEDVKINSLDASSSHQLQNVGIYANGLLVGSTANLTANALHTFNLGSSLILTAGQTATIEIRGDVKNVDGTNATGTVLVSLLAGSSNAQGMESFLTTGVPSAQKDGNSLTIVLGGLSASQNNTGFVSSLTPSSLAILGSYSLQAVTAEDIRISSLTVGVSSSTLSAFVGGVATNISNLYVTANGSAVTQTVGQVSASNLLSILTPNLIVPSGKSLVVNVYGNIGSLSSGTGSTTISAVGYGVNSGTSATATTTGQDVTVSTGSIATTSVTTITTGQSYANSQFVLGGTSGDIVKFNFVATGGTTNIKELSFTGTGITQINSITLSNGTVIPVNQSVSGTTTITGLNIAVPTAAGQDIKVNVSYSSVTDTSITQSGDTATLTLVGYKTQVSGATPVTATLSKASNAMTLVAGKPSLAVINTNTVGIGTNVTLGRITVSAVGNTISFSALPVKITTNANAYTGVLSIYDASDLNTVLATTTAVATSTSGAAKTFTFASGNITTSGPVTYEIRADVSDASGGVNAGNIQTSLGAQASFDWADVAAGGNTSVNVVGTGIYGYPTNASTLTF